jgi:hypothetical protein
LRVEGQAELGAEEHLQQSRHEWWRLLALAALAVLTAEWVVYQRATISRLWGEVREMVTRET